MGEGPRYRSLRDVSRETTLLTTFRGMSAPSVDQLFQAATQRRLADGEVLFRENDDAGFLFRVEAGTLAAQKQSDDGKVVLLRELHVGDVGGLTSALEPRPRSATLRAQGPAVVSCVSHAAFRAALAGDAALARDLLVHLGGKVRDKSRQLATLLARAGRDTRELVVFFDAKPYERTVFDARLTDTLRFKYLDVQLGPDTVGLAHGYPVVCAFVNDRLDAQVIGELARFGTKLLALRCAGFNNVDLVAAKAHGIDVVRVPAYSPHAVAEHAMALVLTLNRKTHRAAARVRDGNFSLAGLVGFDLHGRTAGVVGLGKIGQCFADIARGFGMRVLAFDPALTADTAKAAKLESVDLETLLREADVVSLHAPLNPATHHLLDAQRLGAMKRGAMLINTSRGGLVDTRALLDVLKSGHLGAAGLDVYEEESAYFFRDGSDHAIDDDVLARLLTFPNVLVTSHQGFLTTDALDNIAQTTLENIAAFLAGARGDALPNRVAPPK